MKRISDSMFFHQGKERSRLCTNGNLIFFTLSFYSNFPLNVQEMINLCVKVNKGKKKSFFWNDSTILGVMKREIIWQDVYVEK